MQVHEAELHSAIVKMNGILGVPTRPQRKFEVLCNLLKKIFVYIEHENFDKQKIKKRINL